MKNYSPFDEFTDPKLPKRSTWIRVAWIIGAAVLLSAVVLRFPPLPDNQKKTGVGKKVNDNNSENSEAK